MTNEYERGRVLRVLRAQQESDRRHGVTYPAPTPAVVREVAALMAAGLYPTTR